MFKQILPPTKFWTVQNLVLGCAHHRKRDGKLVGFVPADANCWYEDGLLEFIANPAKGVRLAEEDDDYVRLIHGKFVAVTYAASGYAGAIIANFTAEFVYNDQPFCATGRAQSDNIPGFPCPETVLAERAAAKAKDEAHRQRAREERRTLYAASTPMLADLQGAFTAWIKEAVTDPAQRKIIARYARTGRNKQEFHHLLYERFFRNDIYPVWSAMYEAKRNWQDWILAIPD